MSEYLKKEDKQSKQLLSGVTQHPWLKLIALILAILIWFYVQGELYGPY